MDLEAHSHEGHIKPYIHIFTWNFTELHTIFLLTSYELHMKFMWTSYEFHMIWNSIYSYEIHEKFRLTSYVVRINCSWISYEINQIYSYEFTCSSYEIHMNLYRRTKEFNMFYPYNTNEVDLRLINSTHEIQMKSYEFRMIWTSCELHKNYMTSAQEVPLHYTWIWFLASLLCTSHGWASRSNVLFWLTLAYLHDMATNIWCSFVRVYD